MNNTTTRKASTSRVDKPPPALEDPQWSDCKLEIHWHDNHPSIPRRPISLQLRVLHQHHHQSHQKEEDLESVGLRPWRASYYLAEFLLNGWLDWKMDGSMDCGGGGTVLELGCGIGLLPVVFQHAKTYRDWNYLATGNIFLYTAMSLLAIQHHACLCLCAKTTAKTFSTMHAEIGSGTGVMGGYPI